MLFKNTKNTINSKYSLWLTLALLLLLVLSIVIVNSVNMMSQTNQDIFAYTVKVHDTVEELDKTFERAEVNVNVMVDSIANSYDASKQQNKEYNLKFIKEIDGLVKSVLSNSPNVDGSWFQLNADLPFSTYAYNWYEFKGNQFVNVKNQFEKTNTLDRKITPEDDPYYFEAIANQKATWSAIYVDADTNEAMMTISAPVYKEHALVGVVGVDISTSNLRRILKDMQTVLGESELYLLDKKNNVILSQLSYNSNSPEDSYLFLDLFKGHKQGTIEYYDRLTQKTAIKLNLSNNYKIVITIKNKTLFSGTNQLVFIIYVLFILLILSTAMAFINQFKIMKKNEFPKIVNPNVDEETEQENKQSAKDEVIA